jgi:hypothetical protein
VLKVLQRRTEAHRTSWRGEFAALDQKTGSSTPAQAVERGTARAGVRSNGYHLQKSLRPAGFQSAVPARRCNVRKDASGKTWRDAKTDYLHARRCRSGKRSYGAATGGIGRAMGQAASRGQFRRHARPRHLAAGRATKGPRARFRAALNCRVWEADCSLRRCRSSAAWRMLRGRAPRRSRAPTRMQRRNARSTGNTTPE